MLSKIKICANAIKHGEVVAYPTEAVWGLGCDPFNREAVMKILALKDRSWKKGLILIAGEIGQLDFLLHDIGAESSEKLAKSWPGHISWLIPHHDRVPSWVVGEHTTVAVRVSTHPVVQALCERVGGPIVSTSANPSGQPPARTQTEVQSYFEHTDIMIAPGEVGGASSPSTIKDLQTGKTIR